MRRPGWRAGRVVALFMLLTLLGHGLVLDWLRGELDGLQSPPPMERLAVSYTRVLRPSAPAALPTPPKPHRRAPPALTSAAAAASAVDAAASAPMEEAAPAVAQATSPVGDAAASPAALVQADPLAAASVSAPDMAGAVVAQATAVAAVAPTAFPAAASATAAALSPGASVALAAASGASATAAPSTSIWPRSTRLSYVLEGWYRGQVQGQAQVEWLRQGARYQVHLDVSVGPSFAPLVRRRMSSEGRLSDEDGLHPQRYEQDTRQIIGSNKLVQIAFGTDTVRLGSGQQVASPPDVQDTASQFIQMLYLFTTQPGLSRAGQQIEFGLAQPTRLEHWIYDVAARETTRTPLGELDTVHVRPRRTGVQGVLSAEVWYAPTLQWLPVRLRIQYDADTWMDLRLARAPEQG